jgi:non-ribosomal peptide synthetase component F
MRYFTHTLVCPCTLHTPQVDAASNQLANHLINTCGVAEGDVVGLMMQRCSNMVVAMLGILKAGSAYLPLDPGHPPSRTAFIVGDAGLKVGMDICVCVGGGGEGRGPLEKRGA